MSTLWGKITKHTVLVAVVAAGALLWPAAALAAAPPGTYTFNGQTFNTADAVMTMPVAGGTAYLYDSGMTYNWSDYFGKFTSSTNGSPWWAYRGISTSDAKEFRGCGYVQHRRGEFQLDNDGFYRWNCSAAASVARYIINYRRAPRGMRCLKRGGDTFWCSRFNRGRQTVKLVYRTPALQRTRRYVQSGRVQECGAVSTTNGASGKPGKYVMFAKDDASCDRAFLDHDALMGMAAYTAMKGAPGGDYAVIGVDMGCFKMAGTESMLICTNGSKCVIAGRFSKGQFPRVYDEWAWSSIATLPYDPFSNC